MKNLSVSIEIDGTQREIGAITGETVYTAQFRYADSYLRSGNARPVSFSLPLTEEPFSPEQTRAFFEALLPEGFLRRTVAENNRTDASDYLSLLEMLGAECLGAVQIRGDHFYMPEPEYRPLDPDTMFKLASEGATTSADLVVEAHLSLTGASGKIGAYRGDDGQWYLPVGSAPSTHILKQSHIRYDHIVQNEQLALKTAARLGISTVNSEMIEAHDQPTRSLKTATEVILLAAERYDRTMTGSRRTISGLPCPLRLHQEDFGQALGIAAADKYERAGGAYMKKMFDLLKKYSASPIEDQLKLWDLIVFHWLIGNTDGHIKNFSLVYDRHLRSVRLAPAYDIVSTVVYDNHSSQMALAIGGEMDWYSIRRETFEQATAELGLNRSIFMKRLDQLHGRFETELRAAAEEMAGDGYDEAVDLAETILEKHRGALSSGTIV